MHGVEHTASSRIWAIWCSAALTLLATTQLATADTGVGVDLQLAAAWDPTGGRGFYDCDIRGRSWLGNLEHRTPSGFLYPCPESPPVITATGAWQFHGRVELGYLHQNGDKNNYLFQRFTDRRDGLVLGAIELNAVRPEDGSYVDFRGSSVSDTNQFFKLTVGRYGRYKVEAFVRDLPNVLSNNASPIWLGVGGNNLTVPSTLIPGASTPAQVALLSAGVPQQRLQVNREKDGLAVNYFFTRQWTGYFSFTDEKRRGERAFGGPFFFNYPFQDNGGILETIKPIDDFTLNVNGGLRFAGSTWRFDLGYSGSFYRDRYERFDYQSPFGLSTVVPGAVSASVYQGQFAMEPDNNYNSVRAGATRILPLNGEVSLNVSRAVMSQNDQLIAPINCQGQFGVDLRPLGSPINPFLYNCSDWNTPAALSQRSADMRINTTSVNAAVLLRPTASLTLRGGLRFYEEDYANSYLAYNPLTGEYGFINENGAQASVIPGESGIYNRIVDPSTDVTIRNLPLDTRTREATLGADWRPTMRNTLGATYVFSRYEPDHRERTRLDDSSIKLTWVNRSLDWLTVRANYTYLRRSGDDYNFDPYEFTTSTSLPGYVLPSTGNSAWTVDAERKYDMSDRTENKLDLMAAFVLPDNMSLSTTLRGDWNQYNAMIGRQSFSTLSAIVQWEWQPSPLTSISAFYSYDRSTLHLANINDDAALAGISSNPALGGPLFPYANRWWESDKERNHSVGITLRQQVRRVRIDASWNYLYAKGLTVGTYASPSALAYASDATLDGTAFPANFQRINSFNLSLLIPVNERVSLRIYDYFETSKIADWHYQGFDQTLVFDHRVYTDRGPTDYSANVVGLFVNIKL